MELEINLVLVVSDPAFPTPTTTMYYITPLNTTTYSTVLTCKYGMKSI